MSKCIQIMEPGNRKTEKETKPKKEMYDIDVGKDQF